MSTTNSISTYHSLFDDDTGILGDICFDLDAQQVTAKDKKYNASSWCRSSSSSCCSLCRPPTVSEAEDDSNIVRSLTNDVGFQSRPKGTQGNDVVSIPRGSFDFDKREPQIGSFCGCNMVSSSCCGPDRGLFQVPLKSISIPRSCIDPTASAKADSKESIDCCDYLSTSFVPDDALCHIVKFLDVSSLVRLRECNSKLRDAASTNSAGWKDHCAALWLRKANVCSTARDLLAESNKITSEEEAAHSNTAMEAYKISIADAATRKEISFEEICFDASKDKAGVIWYFRFKESAGGEWTSWDPWWSGRDARKLVFLRDGTMKQAYPKGQESNAKDHNGTLLYDVFSERNVRRDGADVPAPRIEMRWRFVNRPLDLVDRPIGAYIRITVEGRDVPTYVVRRSPNGNWGFVLESCWGVYASFELAPRMPALSAAAGRGRTRLRRTRNGSRWVNAEDSDGSGDDDEEEFERERMRNVRRRIDLFVEESSMTQDAYSQWREALLYNIGAVTLPEGNGDATGEFDHAWQNAMMMR